MTVDLDAALTVVLQVAWAHIRDLETPAPPLPDHPQLAKFVGLVWRKHASGQFVAEETHLAKTGNVYYPRTS